MFKFIRQSDVNMFGILNEMVPAMSDFQVSATMFILSGQCILEFCLIYSSRRDQVRIYAACFCMFHCLCSKCIRLTSSVVLLVSR